MLILEIALGIVLAALILMFLPLILIGLLILLGLGVVLVIIFIVYENQPGSGIPPRPTTSNYTIEKEDRPAVMDKRPNDLDAEPTWLREEVIRNMKESRASAEKLMAIHEEEKNKLAIEYQQQQEFYKQRLIRRSELDQVERALAEAIVRVEEDKRWLRESDIAIIEATKKDKLPRSSRPLLGRID